MPPDNEPEFLYIPVFSLMENTARNDQDLLLVKYMPLNIRRPSCWTGCLQTIVQAFDPFRFH